MKRFWAFVNRHKTKITGLALVVIGSVQANSAAIQELVTPRAFAWFTVIAGALVAGLGFLNTTAIREAESVRKMKAIFTSARPSPEDPARSHTGDDQVGQ